MSDLSPSNRIPSPRPSRSKSSLARRLRPYFILSAIILLVEYAGFSFLQRLLLQDARFTSESLQTAVFEGDWAIPSDAASGPVGVSYDGNYAAYVSGESLVVANVPHHRVQKAIYLKGSKLTILQWLPDRERLVYAVHFKDGSGPMQIWSYDADLGESRLINWIRPRTLKSRIVDLALSTMTNLIYVKVDDGNGKYRLYRLDIMNHIYRQFVQLGTGKIQVLPDRDGVLVEDRKRGRVVMVSGFWGGSETRLTGAMKRKPYVLLGVDEQGRIFLAALHPDARNRLNLFRGTLEHPFRRLTSLPGSTRPGSLRLMPNGQLYRLDLQHHQLVSLSEKPQRRIDYAGRIIAFDGRMLATMEGDQLIIRDTKKN